MTPSEVGRAYRVVVQPNAVSLVPKEERVITATLLDAGGQPVPGVEFQFSLRPSDASAGSVVVEPLPPNRARLRGVQSSAIPTFSAVLVRASAPEFADAQPLDLQVTVVPWAIDSVAPTTASYGETIVLFGRGLANLLPPLPLVLTTGGRNRSGVVQVPVSTVQPDVFANKVYDTMTIWVPAPAESTATFFAGSIGASFPLGSLTVRQRDYLEPNDTAPVQLGVVPPLHFINPALALEVQTPGPVAGRAVDWYTFDYDPNAAGSYGVRLTVVGVGVRPDQFSVLLTDSLTWDPTARTHRVAPGAWAVGTSQICHGVPFQPARLASDSVTIDLSNVGLPAGRYHLLIAHPDGGNAPLRYSLDVSASSYPEYVDGRIVENDYCDLAVPLDIQSTVAVNSWIEQPFDNDWYAFTVAAGQEGSYRLLLDDSARDVTVYVLRDATPDSLPAVLAWQPNAASDSADVALATGNYFLVVADFVGRADFYASVPYALRFRQPGTFATRAPTSKAP